MRNINHAKLKNRRRLKINQLTANSKIQKLHHIVVATNVNSFIIESEASSHHITSNVTVAFNHTSGYILTQFSTSCTRMLAKQGLVITKIDNVLRR